MSIREQLSAAVDLNNSTGSEAECRRLLASFSEAEPGSLTLVYKAQVLTQLARALGLQKRFSEANDVLQGAKNIMDSSAGSGDSDTDAVFQRNVLQIRYLLERGRVLNSSGSGKDSVSYFTDAADQASQTLQERPIHSERGLLEYLAVDALHMLAIVAPTAEERSKFAKQAVELAESSADKPTREWLGPLYNNIAWDCMDEYKFAEAVELFRKAVIIRRIALEFASTGAEKEKAFTPWKIACWSVGHALMKAGKEDEAIKNLNELLEAGADGPSIREDLAKLYEHRGGGVASEHAQKALEFGLDEDGVNQMKSIIEHIS